MDKYGYVMDIPKNMQPKISFSSEVYQQLSQQLSVLDAKYETYSKLKTALNKRQQQVMDFIRDNEPAQLSDIEMALKKSRNTLKKDLFYLVKEKLLLKTGLLFCSPLCPAGALGCSGHGDQAWTTYRASWRSSIRQDNLTKSYPIW